MKSLISLNYDLAKWLKCVLYYCNNLPDNPDAIMTEDCFILVKIVTFPGLSDKYEEMKSLMGYEDVKWTEDDFKDFPDEIKDLFRHLFE